MNDYYYNCGELNELDSNNSYVPTCTPTVVESHNDIGIIVFLGFVVYQLVFGVGFILCCTNTIKKVFKKKNRVNNHSNYFIANVNIDINSNCVICLQNFKNSQAKTLRCGHYFHEDCITQWISIRRNCPLCLKHIEIDI